MFTNQMVKQSSLIHQKIRGASFVPSKQGYTEKFKYNLGHYVIKYVGKKLIAFRNIKNRINQKVVLKTINIDFVLIKKDVSIWTIESLIEGAITNYVVWALLGLEFNIFTMFAWGFAIKQLLSIYGRIKKHGSNATIPK